MAYQLRCAERLQSTVSLFVYVLLRRAYLSVVGGILHVVSTVPPTFLLVFPKDSKAWKHDLNKIATTYSEIKRCLLIRGLLSFHWLLKVEIKWSV